MVKTLEYIRFQDFLKKKIKQQKTIFNIDINKKSDFIKSANIVSEGNSKGKKTIF